MHAHTYLPWVVHDAGVVVRNQARVNFVARVADEVGIRGRYHVFPDNFDVLVSIRSRLLVEEAERMAELVEKNSPVLAQPLLRHTN